MPVNLSTHVRQLAGEVARRSDEAGGPVVLVAPSYAGLVVTEVADGAPDRVSALVHLDADIVDDGQSEWDITTDEIRQSLLDGIGEDGLGVAPLPFFDPRARPHPLATFLQKSRLTGAWQRVPRKRYAAALDTPGGLQAPATMARVSSDPGWHYEEWPTTHNVLRDGPDRVLALLEGL